MSLQGNEPIRPPTRTQRRLAEALCDPTVKTVTQAAKRIGINRTTASLAQRNPTVQREIARIQAAQGDTARSIRRKSLARASSRLDSEVDTVRLMGIAVAAATIEEKVGSEEPTGPSRHVQLELARRLLIAWAHNRPMSERTAELVSSRLEAMEHAIAIYVSAART